MEIYSTLAFPISIKSRWKASFFSHTICMHFDVLQVFNSSTNDEDKHERMIKKHWNLKTLTNKFFASIYI